VARVEFEPAGDAHGVGREVASKCNRGAFP
jgi:hypothetical protein